MSLAIAISNKTPSLPPLVSARATIAKVVERLRQHPDEEHAVAAFEAKLRNDSIVRHAAAVVLFRTAVVDAEAKERRQASEPSSPKHRVERQQQELPDLVMPNQKPMRLCSGGEMAGFGAAYQRIADKVGADCLVGEVLTNTEAEALMVRSVAR